MVYPKFPPERQRSFLVLLLHYSIGWVAAENDNVWICHWTQTAQIQSLELVTQGDSMSCAWARLPWAGKGSPQPPRLPTSKSRSRIRRSWWLAWEKRQLLAGGKKCLKGYPTTVWGCASTQGKNGDSWRVKGWANYRCRAWRRIAGKRAVVGHCWTVLNNSHLHQLPRY